MDKTKTWMHAFILYLDKPYQNHNFFSRILLQTISFMMVEFPCFITPLCFGLIPIFQLKETWTIGDYLFLIYIMGEVGHYLYVKSCLPKLDISREDSTMSQEQRKKMVQLVMDLEPEPVKVMKGWLLEQPENLVLSHFGEWVAWSYFNKRMKDYTLNDFKDSLEIFEIVQKKVNIPINENTAAIPCLAPAVDPVEFRFKPLCVYGSIFTVNCIGYFFLRQQGFQFKTIPNSTIKFWIYEPIISSNKLPICFIHGAGIGLAPYAFLIKKIKLNYSDRKIILLDIPFTSSQIYSKIETRNEILYAIDNLFSICNMVTCSWLAHSFGCSIATYICQYRSRYISKLSLVDPVNFRIWDARTTSYLFYMKPVSFNHSIFCFVVREPVIAHLFARNFVWHYNVMQPKDLQFPTEIYISRDDWLIDGKDSINYLSQHFGKVPHVGVTLLDTTHGGVLGYPDYQTIIVNKL